MITEIKEKSLNDNKKLTMKLSGCKPVTTEVKEMMVKNHDLKHIFSTLTVFPWEISYLILS
jgi:hypothetical protein